MTKKKTRKGKKRARSTRKGLGGFQRAVYGSASVRKATKAVKAAEARKRKAVRDAKAAYKRKKK